MQYHVGRVLCRLNLRAIAFVMGWEYRLASGGPQDNAIEFQKKTNSNGLTQVIIQTVVICGKLQIVISV